MTAVISLLIMSGIWYGWYRICHTGGSTTKPTKPKLGLVVSLDDYRKEQS